MNENVNVLLCSKYHDEILRKLPFHLRLIDNIEINRGQDFLWLHRRGSLEPPCTRVAAVPGLPSKDAQKSSPEPSARSAAALTSPTSPTKTHSYRLLARLLAAAPEKSNPR